MKTRNLVLKIVSAVLCAVSILPLFMHFIALRNGGFRARYRFGEFAGVTDSLVVISRILFITTIVLAMILMVSVVLQFIFKNDILNWVVIGTGIVMMITATLCFVSTLLYCLSISDLGKYAWYPSFGSYLLVAVGVIAPICALLSNYEKN